MNFRTELEKKTADANKPVEQYLPDAGKFPGSLVEAIRYSVLAGGKRIRPVLLRELYEIYGGKGDDAGRFMAALEYIHTASLIHDDLPAIDNDMLRRGRQTTHARYGEPLAILAGDALENYAYEIMFEGIMISSHTLSVVKAGQIIAEKSGYRGMLGGQSVDVENEKNRMNDITLKTLDYIYKHKTSALIEAAMMSGAALAGADQKDISLLEAIGERIGLAFQIQDDILDVTATAERLGKPVFSDEKNLKATYVTLAGIEKASEEVKRLSKEAVEMLAGIPGNTGFIREFINYLSSRDR